MVEGRERKMKVGLKKAARDLLRWNLKGQLRGIPTRGTYLAHRDTFFKPGSNDVERRWHPFTPKKGTKDCYACKIGLVMLGRYGDGAFGLTTRTQRDDLVREIQRYGPKIACPLGDACGQLYPYNPYVAPLGEMIEHLFESHLWGVVRIDKWLAGLAKVDFEEEKAKVEA
jgi:hypothetical protein